MKIFWAPRYEERGGGGKDRAGTAVMALKPLKGIIFKIAIRQ
jgi:hypothetical protein